MGIVLGRAIVAALGCLGLVTSCAPPLQDVAGDSSQLGAQAQAPKTIKIDGSSTVYPITKEMAERFAFEQAKNQKPDIEVNFSGTGGGFRKFCAGGTDINNASRPIKAEEIETCKANGIEFIELPVAFDALTVAVHPNNDWVDEISLTDLKKLWEPAAEGTITTWNQLNSAWPDQRIDLYGPGQDSGTFDYFTEVVMGDSGESRSDYTASEDDVELVNGVIENPNAFGYFGYAYFKENQARLKALAIDSGNGPVEPSPDTVRSSEYQPLSRPLFVYVNADIVAKNPELKAFVEYYLSQARAVVQVVGYEPLPDAAYALALEHLENRKTGTVFGGESLSGLTIEALLEKEKLF